MIILADPIVRAHIVEYRAVVKQLTETKDNPNVTDADRIAVIKQLCELSRDARFQLGPKRYAEPAQLEEVATCFEESADTIAALWEGVVPEEVASYCDNIRERAQRCREG